jgi:hypothetical protein
LPLLKKPLAFPEELLNPTGRQRSKNYRAQIRSYNVMLAMTSMNGNVDNIINDGRCPYIFLLKCNNHNRI